LKEVEESGLKAERAAKREARTVVRARVFPDA
jgi:hypothetical protein